MLKAPLSHQPQCFLAEKHMWHMFLSCQVRKVQHGEWSGGANTVQGFWNQVRCHGVWTGGPPPCTPHTHTVCPMDLLCCRILVLFQFGVCHWSYSRFKFGQWRRIWETQTWLFDLFPGRKIQLHPAHHLHRIDTVILCLSKRPPPLSCRHTSVHSFICPFAPTLTTTVFCTNSVVHLDQLNNHEGLEIRFIKSFVFF